MTTISAKVIADSRCSTSGVRLTTVLLRYPRWIHAELMTHRAFSRNASSSRAIPVKRLLKDILVDPAYPIYWGANRKGMQAGAPLTGWRYGLVRSAWWMGKWAAAGAAWLADKAGAHKQVVNRLIEPFSHINVVVTATQWSNWEALRCHKDAEPHIQDLAYKIKGVMLQSIPKTLKPGQWHTPFVSDDEMESLWLEDYGGGQGDATGELQTSAWSDLVKLSVARCARTSYLTHEGTKPLMTEDFKLHDRLVASVPLHASPAEHQATPDPYGESRGQWGNFSHWRQYRKTLPGECQ